MQAKRLRGNQEIRFCNPVQVYPYVKLIAEILASQLIEDGYIEEEELFREAKIFEEEEIARERSGWPRNHALASVEPHRPHVIRLQRYGLQDAFPVSRLAFDMTHVVEKELV